MKFSYPDLDPQPEQEIPKASAEASGHIAVTPPAEAADYEEPKGPAAMAAHLVSWLLLPIFVPVYGIILVFCLSLLVLEPMVLKLIYVGLVTLLCTVIPVLAGFLLKFLGKVKDIGLNNQNERSIPYVIIALCMGAAVVIFATHGMPGWVSSFYAGGALAALICLCINFKWKISAHCAAMGGLTAMLFVLRAVGLPQHLVTGWIVGAIVASGLLATCRLYLRRHTFWQTMAGWAVGFICVWILSLIIN